MKKEYSTPKVQPMEYLSENLSASVTTEDETLKDNNIQVDWR